MNSRLMIAGSFLGLFASGAIPAQEPRSGVPFLSDIPTIGQLFRVQEETMWFPFGEPSEAKGDDPEAVRRGSLGFHEVWLLRSLRERIKGLRSAAIVDKISVRNDGENRTVHHERGIEARGPSDAVAKARDFLGRFVAQKEQMVSIEARIIDIGDEGVRQGAQVSVVDRKALEARVAGLKARGGGVTITSPTLSVFNTQRANVQVTNTTAYVKDFEVEVVGTTTVVDPVVATIKDGIVFDIRPVIDPDTRDLNLDVKLNLSHLTRPIRELKTEAGGHPVTIQLPEIRSSHFGPGEVLIRPGEEGFMISGLKHTVQKEGEEPETRNVEVWCLVKLMEPDVTVEAGEVIDRDETYGNLFVVWPRSMVPDDPWDKAPKTVTVWRDGKQVGVASLNGGWILGGASATLRVDRGTVKPAEGWTKDNPSPDEKHRVVAIYTLTEGDGRKGDSVK